MQKEHSSTATDSVPDSRRNISIKWQLLGICIFLVTVPTFFLGIVGYNAYKANTQKNTEILLRKIAHDWHQVTETYIDQLDRVLRREEILVQQRLHSIVAVTSTFLNDIISPPGTIETLNPLKLAEIENKLSDIAIGRSGFVFLADQKGKILLSKDRNWQDHKLQEFLSSTDDTPVVELISQVKNLTANETKIFRFTTYDRESRKIRHQMAAIGYYKPWNILVGALTYLTDFKSYELEKKLKDELRYRIADQLIGDHGYIWVLNSEGDFIVSHDRMRDGENILNSQDESGNYFIRQIINNAEQLEEDETIISYYSWQNLTEKQKSKKVVAITYVSGWDWIIGASTYEKDYFKGLNKVRLQFVAISILAILLGSSIGYFFATVLARPIKALNKLSLKAANGQLTEKVDENIINQANELGGLANSFQKMTVNLNQLIEEKEVINATLLQKNEELATAKRALEKSVKDAEQLTKQANMANEAKSTFLANMSHELRTPLNVILGYAQLLSIEENASPKTQDKSRIILQSGNHLLTLINDILDIAKIEAEKLELVIAEFDFQQFIDDVSVMIELEAKQKDIAFCRSFSNDLPEIVRADEKRLKQVLINLLNNAVKFTDEGQVTFEVRRQVQSSRDDLFTTITFSVSDTGKGIPAHALKSIFKPFERVKSPDRQRGGTGLGLAISNEIVTKMGSQLGVESTLGKGSNFQFSLQFELVQTKFTDKHRDQKIEKYSGSALKILIVDDMESNRVLVRKILTTFGFEPYEASSGQEALDTIRKSPQDLLLLDLNMPEMDGYEVLNNLRQKQYTTQPKVIILSGNVSPEEQQRCFEHGADGFLAKPIEIQSLLSSIKRVLELD